MMQQAVQCKWRKTTGQRRVALERFLKGAQARWTGAGRQTALVRNLAHGD